MKLSSKGEVKVSRKNCIINKRASLDNVDKIILKGTEVLKTRGTLKGVYTTVNVKGKYFWSQKRE